MIGKFKGPTLHTTWNNWCFYTTSLDHSWLTLIKLTFILYLWLKDKHGKKQGKKEMVQIGVEDKHAIICVVSCITNGNLMPFQG